MKIRFLQTYREKNARARNYEKGQVYDVSPSAARHFLKHKKAESVIDKTPASKPLPPPEIPKSAPPEQRDLGAGKDAVRIFTQAQEKFRRRELEEE